MLQLLMLRLLCHHQRTLIPKLRGSGPLAHSYWLANYLTDIKPSRSCAEHRGRTKGVNLEIPVVIAVQLADGGHLQAEEPLRKLLSCVAVHQRPDTLQNTQTSQIARSSIQWYLKQSYRSTAAAIDFRYDAYGAPFWGEGRGGG